MLRQEELARFGGIAPVLAHAQWLTARAWQPFRGYMGRDDGQTATSLTQSSEIELIEALYGLDSLDGLRAGVISAGAATVLPVPEGDPGELPTTPIASPDGHESHPRVIAFVQALGAAMPAVVWAIQTESVPDALASGDLVQARDALGDLLVTAADRFPLYKVLTESWAGACGIRHANSDAARDFAAVLVEPYGEHDPIELTDDWNWLVSIGAGDDDGGDQLDRHTLRCFAELDRAQRFAVLQADWTRALVDEAVGGHPRSPVFMRTVVQRLVDYDGTGSVSAHEPDSDWRVTIAARDRSPLPALPTRASH
ncbi:hypothetical protein Q5424_01065 [Conexibacter sp. JD483]|uniref:hypothetical protein n=1 Tax=unclassified Conexibacter TaxID=2627773 RepID=UPI002715E973|nr:MULTISPECIES: hypothetical protein [unclassified Conexibacter]MDO8185818.1 hypothetical protein [Conexibacter sp. CPCC 205706]MDO8198562.1 hypothetical protein [Conexibacter sp. CPCC 205762]MDR9367648.1 hypothetical protein [Conexibacter sp. JD483]